MRAIGPRLALLSGLLDMLKGTAAVGLAWALGAGVEGRPWRAWRRSSGTALAVPQLLRRAGRLGRLRRGDLARPAGGLGGPRRLPRHPRRNPLHLGGLADRLSAVGGIVFTVQILATACPWGCWASRSCAHPDLALPPRQHRAAPARRGAQVRGEVSATPPARATAGPRGGGRRALAMAPPAPRRSGPRVACGRLPAAASAPSPAVPGAGRRPGGSRDDDPGRAPPRRSARSRDFPKPGILFYDITTLLKDPRRLPRRDRRHAGAVRCRARRRRRRDGSRGFIFSAPLAYQLNAGLVPVRKLGKCRRDVSVEYASSTGRTRSRSTATRSSPAEGPHRRRPPRHRRDGPRHGRAGPAPPGRDRGPRLPRRAHLPQGPRPPGGPGGDLVVQY